MENIGSCHTQTQGDQDVSSRAEGGREGGFGEGRENEGRRGRSGYKEGGSVIPSDIKYTYIQFVFSVILLNK